MAEPRVGKPASANDKELLRLLGRKIPKGLTDRAADRMLAEVSPEEDAFIDRWSEVRDTAETLMAEYADYAADFGIRKPRLAQIHEVVDTFWIGEELADEATDADLVADELKRRFPDLVRVAGRQPAKRKPRGKRKGRVKDAIGSFVLLFFILYVVWIVVSR